MKLYTFTPAKWTGRRLAVIVLVVLLLGSGVGMAVSYFTASQGASFSNGGINVTVGGPNDEEFRTGDIFGGAGSNLIYLHNTSFLTAPSVVAPGANRTVTVPNNLWNGTTGWVNMTISGAGNMTVAPDNVKITNTTINGTFTALNITSVIPQDAFKEDIAFSTATDGGEVWIANLTANKFYGLVDPVSLQAKSTAQANGTGVAHFENIAATSNAHLAVQEVGTLFIRNQSQPNGKIDDVVVTVLFMQNEDREDPIIVEKSTADFGNDGYISLTDLDISQPYIIQLSSPDHYPAISLIDSIVSQTTVFMLELSKPRSQTTFIVADATGKFGVDDGTSMTLSRGLNSSSWDLINGTGPRWLVIGGSTLGNSAIWNATSLETEVFYRIVIENNRGDVRSLGTYVPKNTAGRSVVTLDIKNVNFTAAMGGNTFAWNASVLTNPNVGRFDFNDTRRSTTNLNWNISIMKNNSLVYSSPGNCISRCGEFSEVVPLNNTASNSTLLLRWSAQSNSTWIGGTDVLTGPNAYKISPLPISTTWLNLGSIGALFIVGALCVGIGRPPLAGVVISCFAGILWALGLLSFGENLTNVQSGSLIFMGMLISVMWWIGEEK